MVYKYPGPSFIGPKSGENAPRGLCIVCPGAPCKDISAKVGSIPTGQPIMVDVAQRQSGRLWSGRSGFRNSSFTPVYKEPICGYQNIVI